MNREKPYFLRRVVAYLIDVIIVMLLSSIITTIIFNTGSNQTKAEQIVKLSELTNNYETEKINQEEYTKELNNLKEKLTSENADSHIIQAVDLTIKYATSEITKEEYNNQLDELVEVLTNEGVSLSSVKLIKLLGKYSSGEITSEEFNKEYNILNYYVTKENVPTSIAYCAIALIYYVIMCYFCHGITLGKYIMKIRIVSANDKELNMGHYLIRSLYVNLILNYLMSIILVFTLKAETFSDVSSKVSTALTLLLLATLIFIMYREDGRGLHDLLANTKVISTKKDKNAEDNVEENVEVKEATVVKEEKRKRPNGKSNKVSKKEK